MKNALIALVSQILIICGECSGVVLMEVSDFSDSHLSPTNIGNLDLGLNTVSGSILGPEAFDSDAFTLSNPNGYSIDSITVQISSFLAPVYPPFDPTDPFIGQLPGVILVLPNDGGAIPSGNGSYQLSNDFDEIGLLLLEEPNQLSFSVFFDSRPELLASGGFDYSVDVIASIPEVSSVFLLVNSLILLSLRRTR